MTALPIADKAAVRQAAKELLARDKRAITVILALHAAAAAAGLAGPWLLGVVVDRVTAGTDVSTVDILTLAIAGAFVAQTLLNRYALYAGHRFGERAVAQLREQFVSRTLALPVSTVERAGTGDLATRSSVDVAAVGLTVRDVMPTMVVATVQLVLLFGAVFLLHPLLGLVALAGMPTTVAGARWYLRRASPAYLAEGAATANLTEALTTTAEGARTVESLHLTDHRIRTGTEKVGEVFQARMRTLALRSRFYPVVEASYAIPVSVILVAGGFFLHRGWVSLGEVVAAVLYLQQTISPLDRLLEWMEQAQRGLASFARVLGVGRVPVEAGGVEGVSPGLPLTVSGVSFAYGSGRDVLTGIDLTVRPGERLAVVGPSGAGKSTLARLLAGIDAPRAGTVRLGPHAVTDLDPAERRRRIALITQEHHVFAGTLRDNLTFAAPAATDDALAASLSSVGADWFLDLPEGLDTVVGDGTVGHQLGAAEAQQLALARLLLADPYVLILDEATAALDPTTARRTERALAAVLSGRTVIAIAHRLNTAHDADRVAVLDDGQLTELGTHDELIEADGAYAALWRSWHG